MFRCTACDKESLKWSGQCPHCNEWNTLEETAAPAPRRMAKTSGTALPLRDLKPASGPEKRVPLASQELTNALGGGLVEGSLTLLSGEPGIGKSTLALQAAGWYCQGGRAAVYVSGEESAEQVAGRARRLGVSAPGVRFLSCQSLEDALATVAREKAGLVVVDSVSVLYSNQLPGGLGSVQQVRVVAEAFMEFAKRSGTSVVLIGHVTKDGDLAGPKTLEHLVDTVLFLEGSKHEDYRILRVLKNRFGPTDEVALFRMEESGLADLPNPGMEFAGPDRTSVGSALGITMEGSRPLVVEVEALTSYTKFGYPKRTATGIPAGRLDLLLAVIGKFGKVAFEEWDAYLAVARGLRVTEPAIDLAAAAALVSSRSDKPLGNSVFVGEISLTGRVKPVARLDKRLDELDKLGFARAVVPAESLAKLKSKKRKNLEVVGVGTVGELVKVVANK